MCDPLTATALALTAAGSYAQYRGSKIAQNAMTNAQTAENARQKSLRSEADAAFAQSIGNQSVESQQQKLADAVAERQATADASQVAAPVADVAVKGGTPSVVADETAARVGAGNLKAAAEGRLKAAMSGFSDLQLGNALENAKFSQRQANLSRFMTDSAGVLGTELEAASKKGDKAKNLGSALQLAGQLVGMYGAMSPTAAAPSQATSLGVKAIGPSGSAVTNGSTLGVTPFGRFVSMKPPGF